MGGIYKKKKNLCWDTRDVVFFFLIYPPHVIPSVVRVVSSRVVFPAKNIFSRARVVVVIVIVIVFPPSFAPHLFFWRKRYSIAFSTPRIFIFFLGGGGRSRKTQKQE